MRLTPLLLWVSSIYIATAFAFSFMPDMFDVPVSTHWRQTAFVFQCLFMIFLAAGFRAKMQRPLQTRLPHTVSAGAFVVCFCSISFIAGMTVYDPSIWVVVVTSLVFAAGALMVVIRKEDLGR